MPATGPDPRYGSAGRSTHVARTLPPTLDPCRAIWSAPDGGSVCRHRRRSGMTSSPRARVGRIAVVATFLLGTLLPGAAPAIAADPLILNVGTDQTFSGLNPWQSVYVVD